MTTPAIQNVHSGTKLGIFGDLQMTMAAVGNAMAALSNGLAEIGRSVTQVAQVQRMSGRSEGASLCEQAAKDIGEINASIRSAVGVVPAGDVTTAPKLQ